MEHLIAETNDLLFEAAVLEGRVKAVRVELEKALEKGVEDIGNFFREVCKRVSWYLTFEIAVRNKEF